MWVQSKAITHIQHVLSVQKRLFDRISRFVLEWWIFIGSGTIKFRVGINLDERASLLKNSKKMVIAYWVQCCLCC